MRIPSGRPAEIDACVGRPYRAFCQGVSANDPATLDRAVTLLQYASFDIFSDVFTPDQMSEVLGLGPSRVSWRGARQSNGPVIPRSNIWSFRATGTGQPDEQISQLLDRFEPLSQRLEVLTAGEASSLSISLVRYFDVADESEIVLRRDEGSRFDGVSIEGFCACGLIDPFVRVDVVVGHGLPRSLSRLIGRPGRRRATRDL